MRKLLQFFSYAKKWFLKRLCKGEKPMDIIKQVNPVDLSKYVIKYVNDMGHEVSHLKLQKLIYYIDAWHYVLLEKPIIKENFEAWMHGPVVRQLWNYYKDVSTLNAILVVKDDDRITLDISEEQLEVINDVLDEYGNKSAYYLECLTHEEKPWIAARIGFAPSDKCDRIISKALMKEFYGAKIYGEEQIQN